MKWLRLWPHLPEPLIWMKDDRNCGAYLYDADDELVAITNGYNCSGHSHLHAGVLADYLTDHRDSLLTGATGPSDPSVRLDQLIEYLRGRFRSQYEQTQ